MKREKKYKKNWGKLFQVRLSEEEYHSLKDFINRFGITHREFLFLVQTELREATVVRDGKFWRTNTEYAYSIAQETYRKPENIPEHCVLCFDKFRKGEVLHAHHYMGYAGDNATNVKFICKRCHGFCHRKECKDKTWEDITSLHTLWDGKNRNEEINNYFIDMESLK